jgi:hypothetical protein
VRLAALLLLGCAGLLAACGGDEPSRSGPAPGYERLRGGGATVDVPDSMKPREGEPPMVLAAGPADEPAAPRLHVSAATPALGNFLQVINEDLYSNPDRLLERHVTLELHQVKVPGAKQAMECEWTFRGGRPEGPFFTSHVWVRYAEREDRRIFALLLVVPEPAKGSVDPRTILDSFTIE